MDSLSYLSPRFPAPSLPFLFHMLSYAFPSRFSSLLFNCPSLLPHLSPLPTCLVSLPHFLLPFPPLSCPASNWFIPFFDHMGICTSSVVIRDSAGPYFVGSVSVCVCVLYTCMYVCGTSRRGCLWTTLACVSCCFSQFC